MSVIIQRGASVSQKPDFVVTGSSTTTPLDSNTVFTGSWADTLNYGVIDTSVFADAPGFMEISWSQDASTVDVVDRVDVVDSVGRNLSFTPASRYFKIDFTNASVKQGTLRLQTILRTTKTHPGTEAATEDTLAIIADAVRPKILGDSTMALATHDDELIELTRDIKNVLTQFAYHMSHITGLDFEEDL